jgi:S1-C subfamily serine protease
MGPCTRQIVKKHFSKRSSERRVLLCSTIRIRITVRVCRKVDGAEVVPLKCTGASQQTGTEVYAIGTPKTAVLSQTLTKGIISSKREFEGRSFIQTDVGINQGNSGGPLIDTGGTVIGIVAAKLIGIGTESIAFAIPIGDAFSALHIR